MFGSRIVNANSDAGILSAGIHVEEHVLRLWLSPVKGLLVSKKQSNNVVLLKTLGEVIVERRKRLGMTQDELSELSGINRAFISNIEKGKRNPSIGAVASLAKGLKLKTSLLLSKCEKQMTEAEEK